MPRLLCSKYLHLCITKTQGNNSIWNNQDNFLYITKYHHNTCKDFTITHWIVYDLWRLADKVSEQETVIDASLWLEHRANSIELCEFASIDFFSFMAQATFVMQREKLKLLSGREALWRLDACPPVFVGAASYFRDRSDRSVYFPCWTKANKKRLLPGRQCRRDSSTRRRLMND